MVFPKPGLLHRSSTPNSRFTYFSLLTILNLAFIASTVVESLFYLYNWTVADFGINKSFMMVFIITTIFVCGDLHRLARSWPTLSKSWFNQDLTLRSKFNQRPRINCKKYFLQLTVLTFVGQVVLSALYIWWSYDNTLDNMTFCQYPQNYSVLELWHRRERSHIFSYIKFQTWMSPLLQLQFFVTDLGWIFSQNLVIFCSIWITTRFQQLYDQVQEEIRTGSNLKWKEIHNHFNQLVDLVNDVDRELGNSVILTCSTRLFLICYDLFKSTRYNIKLRLIFHPFLTLILINRADEGIDVCTYTFYRLLFYGFMVVLFIWKASDIPVIAEKIKTSLLRIPEVSVHRVMKFTIMIE